MSQYRNIFDEMAELYDALQMERHRSTKHWPPGGGARRQGSVAVIPAALMDLLEGFTQLAYNMQHSRYRMGARNYLGWPCPPHRVMETDDGRKICARCGEEV
jgi:hypothetical protein